MRNYAQEQEVSYPPLIYTNWDADKLYGCKCDAGYGGFDCSEYACPRGDDPLDQSGRADEVQVLRCDYRADSNTQFRLTLKGKQTPIIGASDNSHQLQAAIQSILGVGLVNVRFRSADGTISTVCDDRDGDGKSESVVEIEFREHPGDVPPLVPRYADGRVLDGAMSSKVVLAYDGAGLVRGGDGAVISSERGTTEGLVCSGRGYCASSGDCHCFPGFTSGRGYSGVGGLYNDCGAVAQGATIAACPGSPLQCSGHGRCRGSPTFRCECDAGWAAGDCSRRACSTGPSWFDHPTSADDVAHGPAVCSDRGTCNQVTGECVCYSGFAGAACERMACPLGATAAGSSAAHGGQVHPLAKLMGGMARLRGFADRTVGEQLVCAGNGQCVSMEELAERAKTALGEPDPHTYGRAEWVPAVWDSRSIFGCDCDEGWEGHNCALRTCPSGPALIDDARGLLAERQSFTCSTTAADPAAAAFRVTFRGATTGSISGSSTAAEVGAAIRELPTVAGSYERTGTRGVEVTVSGSTACAVAPAESTVTVHFVTVHGDLPPLRLAGAGGTLVPAEATEERAGTTQLLECSGHGLCDRALGQCDCFGGWGASDGQGGVGDMSDCGHRRELQYMGESLDRTKWRRPVAGYGLPKALRGNN